MSAVFRATDFFGVLGAKGVEEPDAASAAAAIDHHLIAIGAEPVPPTEWPGEAVGYEKANWPGDRRPFGNLATIEADIQLVVEQLGQNVVTTGYRW